MIVGLWLVACSAPPPRPSRKHAVLLVIDTLRADAVEKAATPELDALAAAGDSAPNAWSAGTWTVPSVISLFGGMPVRQHGWDLPAARMGRYPPIPDVPLLAEVLRDAGFVTDGLYANPYLAERLGFDRGFGTWERTADAQAPERVARLVAGWDDGRRHFLYVHLLGPHSALRPSPESAARWGVDPAWIDGAIGFDVGAAQRDQIPGVREAYAAAYHAVVEDTDARVGEIVRALGDHRGDTALIVTSDHGEMLGERGHFAHGAQVWSPLSHVPLVVVNAGRLPDALSNAAVPEILTSALGVPHAWAVTREEPLPLVTQREGKVAFSPDGRLRLVADGESRVFDLSSDPGEDRPIPERLPEMEAARQAWEARVPAAPAGEAAILLDPETVKALEALGYAR